MLKNGFRSWNRAAHSKRALSTYNNNNNNNATSNANSKFCPFGATTSKKQCTPSPLTRAISPNSNSEVCGFGSTMIKRKARTYATQASSQQAGGQEHESAPPPAASSAALNAAAARATMESHHEVRISILQLINEFANYEIPQISLNDMLKFKDFDTENHKLDNEISLLEHANHALYTLMVLNCKRLKDFKQLPYICILNPNIAEILNTYIQSLEKLMEFINNNSTKQFDSDNIVDFYRSFKIGDLETNAKFLKTLEEVLLIHSDNLPILSEGFKDISLMSLIDNDQKFLNDHLKERILLRLTIKHHILLSNHFKTYADENAPLGSIGMIGMIDKNLDVLNLIRQVVEFVNDMSSLKYDEKISVELETIILESGSTKAEKFTIADMGDRQLIFPYISTHLEYVLQELLKNSSRAHIENNERTPIQITIVINKRNPQSYLEMRIRDQGKGISHKSIENLFTYSFTTVAKTSRDDNDNYDIFNSGAGTDANVIAGLGYGLPLSKLYAEMFGGGLELQSYEGWGTDVYVKLRGPESKLLG